MKKFKNMMKKGGVADIVTLMVIVGLVIALIIAVVLPMINSAKTSGNDTDGQLKGISKFTDNIGTINESGVITTPTPPPAG